MLLCEFAGRVQGLGPKRSTLADPFPHQRLATEWATVVKLSLSHVRLCSWEWLDASVLFASVLSVAVDDHRRRKNEPSTTGPMHGGEKDRHAIVVMAGISGGVVGVNSGADDRSLMTDHVYASQGEFHCLVITDIKALNSFGSIGWVAVCRGEEHIDGDNLVSGL
jgi:hypothetical protein